ncbi:NAD(P)-binding protein [Camillea tinctor]|nr:NAD(P)-binding protein [Camillea tinctor]
MPSAFDISPEKEGSKLNFFYRQLTKSPVPVRDVSLAGKTAIVTGSNVGVGLECSRQLLDLGLTKLILGVRNIAKGEAAAADLSNGRDLAEGTIEVWELDYSSYSSVCSFAERAKTLEHLDIAVLNAGIMASQARLNTNTGHEDSIQVNYLSMAVLTILLLPVMKSKQRSEEPGRITITSSDASAWAKFKERNQRPLLSAFDNTQGVDMLERTFVSKLLGQLFLFQLAKRVPSSVAVINAATPGMVHDSEISRETALTFPGNVAEVFRRRIGYTAAVGARMITDAAVRHGKETHGQYLGLQQIKPMAPIVYTPEGERVGQQLWQETLAEFSFAEVEQILREMEMGDG